MKMMRYDQLSDTQQSQIIGKNRNYFYKVKRHNPELYHFMRIAGFDVMSEGYRAYIELKEKVHSNFMRLYSELEEKRMVTGFAKEYGYAKSTVAKLGTRTMDGIKTFKLMRRLEKMIPEMEEYIVNHPIKI